MYLCLSVCMYVCMSVCMYVWMYTTCDIHLIHLSIYLQKEHDTYKKEDVKKTGESKETKPQNRAISETNLFGEENDWITLGTGSIRKEQPLSGKKNSKKSFNNKDLFSALDDEVGLFGKSLPSAKELEKKKKRTSSVSIFGPVVVS